MKEYNFNFNCAVTGPHSSVPACEPHIFDASPGIYNIELWGAQGGSFPACTGGHGGYVKGVVSFVNPTKLYFYLGESGFQGTDYRTLTRQTFGFGGRGNCIQASEVGGCSGGGMTWVTINSPSIENAIMKAAGGSGAAMHSNVYHNGSAAGGLEGRDGTDGIYEGQYYAKGKGGKQDSPGTNSGNSDRNGGFNYGGSATASNHIASGGGAGHYGGAAGLLYGSTGGGGSSWTSPITVGKPQHKAGDELMPSPDSSTWVVGREGHGAARITFLQGIDLQCTDPVYYWNFQNIIYEIFVFIDLSDSI